MIKNKYVIVCEGCKKETETFDDKENTTLRKIMNLYNFTEDTYISYFGHKQVYYHYCKECNKKRLEQRRVDED